MTFRFYPLLLAMLCISLFFSFSCTTDIDLPPPPSNYSSSGLPAGTIYCQYGSDCLTVDSGICTSIGGHQVASCPDVSSSSSTPSAQSSSSKISSSSSSSSSRASSSSSSLPTGTVFCEYGTNCLAVDSEICSLLNGSIVSSCNSVKTRSVIIEVKSLYGEGWGYNYLAIDVNGTKEYITLDEGYSERYGSDFNVGDVVKIYWTGDADSYPEQCAFSVYYADGGSPLVNKDFGYLYATSNETLVGSFVVTAP